MTLRRRVWFNLAAVNGCALTLAGIAAWAAHQTREAVDWLESADAHHDATVRVAECAHDLADELGMALSYDPCAVDLDDRISHCNAHVSALEAAAKSEWQFDADEIDGTDVLEETYVISIVEHYRALRAGVSDTLALAQNGQLEDALTYQRVTVRPLVHTLLSSTTLLSGCEASEIKDRQAEIVGRSKSSLWLVASGCGLLVLTTLTGLTRLAPVSREVMCKLEVLEEATRAISRGNFDHRVSGLGHDELGRLADHFNQMAVQLRRQRTELEAAERHVREISRQAGMAEIATSVLHNVGNALNSAGVSANVTAEQVRKSKAAELATAVRLLQEHADDLGAFLSEGSRGQDLLAFLSQLAQCLGDEQETLSVELASLRRSLDHVKAIVGKQQEYARHVGAVESVDFPEVLEDALKMDGGWVGREGVRIVRDYAKIGPVSTDRHCLMEILLNLLSNARHALKDADGPDRCLTLRVKADGARVRIIVEDNGVGIPPENLDRIFQYGFTTKFKGHGFGLHGAFLAASKLGGELSVQSAGAGLGATFILELPRRREEVIV